jgi:hypothetical protein
MKTNTGGERLGFFLGNNLFGFLGLVIIGHLVSGVLGLDGFTASGRVEHTRENHGNIVGGFRQGKDSNGNGSTESPSDGNEDPEGKVTLGKDTGGDRKDGPHKDKDQSEGVSTTGDPALGTTKFVGVLFLGGQTTHVLLDKSDGGVEVSKVEVGGVNEHGVEKVDESRGENGNQVSAEHDLVGSEVVDGDGATLDLGGDQPTDKGEDKSRPGGDDGTSSRGLLPGHHVPERNDGRSNHHSHKEVDPSEVESELEENNGEDSHEETEDNNDDTGDKEDLGSGGFRVDVLAVDVVGDQRRDGNGLGGSGRHNGHEEHDKDKGGTGVSEQLSGDGGRDETRTGFSRSDGEHEGGGGKTQRSGQREGDGKPADSKGRQKEIEVSAPDEQDRPSKRMVVLAK